MLASMSLHGKWWAALPARPMLDADKKVVIGDDGKVKYVRSLWFDDRETADKFSAAVVEAVMKERSPPLLTTGFTTSGSR